MHVPFVPNRRQGKPRVDCDRKLVQSERQRPAHSAKRPSDSIDLWQLDQPPSCRKRQQSGDRVQRECRRAEYAPNTETRVSTG